MAAQAEVVRRRGELRNTKEALKRKRLTVGYIGGSITDGRPGHNWPEPVTRWLVDQFPEARITVENAGIGATGSNLAAFRAQRDLIDPGCELVFVEFAVNDWEVPTQRRNKTREGLLRQLLADGKRDVVIVYTYRQEMYEDMVNGRVPDSIAEFEALAEHYGLNSVWMGLHALQEVRRGLLQWEEWLPDGLHPTQRGSFSYGTSVIGLLQEALLADEEPSAPASEGLPAPLTEGHWQNARLIPFDDIRTEGPWTVRRWVNLHWIDYTLSTFAVGAKLGFDFEGTVLALAFDFGKRSAEFRYRLDGGEWAASNRIRPDWCGTSGWMKIEVLFDDLAPGRHSFELEVVHGNEPGCEGTNFDLAFVGVVQEA
ncbi:SGNH/GDSL hydrolase family protein [Cohnella fermenti]|uniref:SGNH/GDSL hydrolase family protein n=1 Tax=Cohnella fermenti TaxID=2565925 RepID=A0A4S4BH19_9BACL|nr:SGNH/GDSL hydrolase family protein [Cohnella fermenti]THF72684.1 SGNH/GDSL hydrolase family protein [Cohnella fermenti]